MSAWLGVFIAAGVFLVVAYNLELFGGAFHSDLWFAIAWGGFPAITGAFAQDGRLTVAAVLVAAACVALSAAQRTLSTPVRRLRRRVASVDGTITCRTGPPSRSAPSDRRGAGGGAEAALARDAAPRGRARDRESLAGRPVVSAPCPACIASSASASSPCSRSAGSGAGREARAARPGGRLLGLAHGGAGVAGAQAVLGTIMLLTGRRLDAEGARAGPSTTSTATCRCCCSCSRT